MVPHSYNQPEEIKNLWESYTANPATHTLEPLMKAYLPLVKNIASGFIRKKPHSLDYDDLVQAGNMGLMEAIGRFNPEMGASFKTYATIRIRGSILDEINSMDWTPRSVRKNIKSVLKSIEKHYAEGGNNPTPENLLEHTELTPDELSTILSQMNKTYMVNLEQEVFELASPSVTMEKEELAITVNNAMENNLTDDEKGFIIMKFFYEYDNKRIMKELGVNAKELAEIKLNAMETLAHVLSDYKLS
jgi:RNA polymerase sigma factor for flagellar operon FliA